LVRVSQISFRKRITDPKIIVIFTYNLKLKDMKTLLNLLLQFMGLAMVAFGNDLGLLLLIPAFVQLVRMDTARES
jgi:hypothetical protein